MFYFWENANNIDKSAVGHKNVSEDSDKMKISQSQNTLRHKSQQDPLWPTSQDIRNKSKNKQMGPNET